MVSPRVAEKHVLGVGEFEERYLPCPAAVGLAVEVEFVGDEGVDWGVGSLAESHVGHDFCGGADDGRLGVDGGIPSDHPYVLCSEEANEVEELL